MDSRWRYALAAVLLLLATFTFFTGNYPSLSAQNSSGPQYTRNQQLPLPFTAGSLPLKFVVRALEPGLAIDQDGTIYVDSIRGVPGGVDMHRWSPLVDGPPNADGTLPFKYLGQPDNCGVLNGGCAAIGIAEGGGDVDAVAGFPAAGEVPNVALTSQMLVPGETSTKSGDRGESWSAPNLLSNPIVGEDREWMAAIGSSTVYMAVHDAATFNINVFRSVDGGQNYTDGYGQGIDPQTFPAAGSINPAGTANVAGQLNVDLSQCSSRGNLYTIFTAPDSVTENATGATYRSVYVGVSTDAKQGLPVYTFTDHKVFAGPAGVSNANLFPALAVDAFGYVYAVWSNNANVYYSYSADQGSTFSAPMQVNQGGTIGKANVFPWVTADANGHIAIGWYSSDRAGNSNDTAVMAPCPVDALGNFTSTTCMSGWANWHVYVAESVNAHSLTPLFVQTVAGDHVNHRGTISTGGLTGSANRDMGDFFKIAFDPQHRVNIAYDDDSQLHPTQSVGANPDDPSATRLIRTYFTRQTAAAAGIVTTGTCAGTSPTRGSQLSGAGAIGAGTKFGITAHDSPMNAAIHYEDSNAPLDVKSSNGAKSVSFSGSCVQVNGDAKVNDTPGYTYEISACDNGSPGTQDTFSIVVKGLNFNYSKGGKLTSGNLSRN